MFSPAAPRVRLPRSTVSIRRADACTSSSMRRRSSPSTLSRSTTILASDRSLPIASRTPAELSRTLVSTPWTAACNMPSDWLRALCWLLTVSTWDLSDPRSASAASTASEGPVAEGRRITTATRPSRTASSRITRTSSRTLTATPPGRERDGWSSSWWFGALPKSSRGF
jgi:hypothetical protein